LTRIRKALQHGDDRVILDILTEARVKRNNLVEKKLQRKELPV